MGKKINLYLETSKGLISIPFLSIKDADTFTVEYYDRNKFLAGLFKMLDLPLVSGDVGKMYLRYRDGEHFYFDYEHCLPVKYGKDNFNVSSLISTFAAYLEEKQERLRMDGVRNVGEKIIYNFKPGYVSTNDIKLIANAYLKNDYRKMRDTYFMLTSLADDEHRYSIKIDKIPQRKYKIEGDNLAKLESKQDDYIQYLIGLAARSEDGLERAMDELSKIDLEEINKSLHKSYYSVLDGISDDTLLDPREVKEFEDATDMRLSSIQELCKNQLNNGRKR